MAYPVPPTWYVNGILLNNGVPFTQGKLEAYNRLSDGTLEWLAETSPLEDGRYTLTFPSSGFQGNDASIDHPNLVVRLYDFQGNVIWESDTFAAMETPFELGSIDITAKQDDDWNIEGLVFYNVATPLSSGNVFVYDVWNGQRVLLKQTALNTKGYFSCSYLKSSFQKPGENRNAPNLEIVVRNIQGECLATYDVPNPVSAHQVVQIPLNAVPNVLANDNCKVYGTVKNTLGYPLLTDITVAAFCLYYKKEPTSKNGTFERKMLGEPVQPDKFGHYEIVYDASAIPLGLKLDAKVAKGKDKASIFAEVHYEKGGTNETDGKPKSFYSAPLVFNGQSIQEINFVLDLETDKAIKSEFESINDSLKIYYETIIASDAQTIKENPQDKIAEFLETVTQLPLVIGREGVEEKKVRAYFKAFQLAHELNNEDIFEGENISECAQYLYPLILNHGIVDVSSLLSSGIDECSKNIKQAIKENVISSTLNAQDFCELIFGKVQASLKVAQGMGCSFSAFSVFYLFLTRELDLNTSLGYPYFSKIQEGNASYSEELLKKHQALLKAFTEAGCNYYNLIESLKKNELIITIEDENKQEQKSFLSSTDIEDLCFLVELCEFCNWYLDLIVSAYKTVKNTESYPGIKKLEDILLLTYNDCGFWYDVLGYTVIRYRSWCNDASLNLPLDQFPGTTSDEQFELAVRTLKDRLKAKFPQAMLNTNMETFFQQMEVPYQGDVATPLSEKQLAEQEAAKEQNEWHALFVKLQTDAWKNFDLNSSDLEAFLKASAEAKANEKEIAKIKTLQRLYRLTNDFEAIAYLIKNGFDSASSIALVDEERFVAEHGLGMGDKELATNIHRLAKNFVANATLDIERYHNSLNETDAEIVSLPRGFQKGQDSSASSKAKFKGARIAESTNVASKRLQNKSYANWKTLFGRINRNSGTQNQSILSASAYLLDLLDFLKQGHAYGRFIKRRPDVKDLLMTKANAEVSLPTIDLAIELLESLVSGKSVKNNCRIPACNQTPDTATVADLRANPCTVPADIEQAAMEAIKGRCYPMVLLKDFDKVRAQDILENLSLDFVSLSSRLHSTLDTKKDGENFGNITLLLNGYDPKFLVDDKEKSPSPVWSLWGLSELDNNGIYFPDKSRQVNNANMEWYQVLSYLPFVLDRAHLTYDEFSEIFESSVFENFEANVNVDSESYQLADVNGYKINFDDSCDKEDFFFKLSVFVRRRAALGWSVADVAKNWDCSVEELTEIQELKIRLGISVQEAAILLGKYSLTREELQEIFPIDSLFETYSKGTSVEVQTGELLFQLATAANVCLGIDLQDALLILQEYWQPAAAQSVADNFENGLSTIYRYNLWISRNELSVEDYLFLEGIGFPVKFDNRDNCNALIEKLELLRKSSLSINDLKSILEPKLMTKEEALAFAKDLYSAVQESLLECAVHEKEKVPDPENSNTSKETDESEYDYKTAIFGLLKTLDKEKPQNVEIGVEFYNNLREELVAQRVLSLIAEKFSMTTDVVAELFEKLKDENFDDLAEWVNFALRENVEFTNDENESGHTLIKKLCNRIVRCSALYQFTQSLNLGFDWDWNNLVVGNFNFKKFEEVLYAFAASSQILGEVYKYSELANFETLNKKIKISEETFKALFEASTIKHELNANNGRITSLNIGSPAAWCKFADLLYLYQKTNSLPEDLCSLLKVNSNNVAVFEKNLKRARTNSEWNKFIQGINDKMRQGKRNALAAIVCHDSQYESDEGPSYPSVFLDENDIYSYYLFDVKMEPDMAISRTVQAVSCIQLYVQRALMGLEGSYTLNDTQKEQWEWMKNYQVWVANRKIFLYPENWIDGDLREDKTPFFKDLEDRLAEIDNDQDALTEALGEYLKKVCDTSEIDIVGACKQEGGNAAGVLYTLHIVGRTRGEPYSYYYRRYEATALYGGSWTPWEELPLEIEGESIQPAILGGRLHILWLQVIQGERQKKSGESGGQQATVTIEYYAEIRLKWASFTGTKWTGVKVGKQAVYDISDNQLNFILGENENLADRYFVIDISDNSDTLNLQVWRTFPNFVDTQRVVTVPVASSTPLSSEVGGLNEAPATTYVLKTEISREYKDDQWINHIGNFSLTQDGSDTASNQVEADTGNPIAFTYGELVKDHSPSGCRLIGNTFHNAGGSLVLLDGTEIFNNTRGPFKLLSVNMGFICHVDRPFFYMDSKGTYLIRTVSGDGGAGANSIPNYRVEMVSNPQTGEFHRRFAQGGTKWLYNRETEALPVSDSYYYSYSYYNYYFSVYLGYYTAGDWQAWDLSQTLFEHSYLPSEVVAEPYPSSTVDFSWGTASSIYNWELFFFVPMLMADKMLANQNYEAALNWLQLVFDPRIDLTSYERTKRFVKDLPRGARYWKFLPFFANQDADKSILSELSFPTPHDALPDRQAILLLQDRWKNDPFDPQMIARYRPVAYQKYVVMKYLDALIGWGDQLFTQDTTESVNLAIQMYVLAAEILGPKSAEVPGPKTDKVSSVQELMENGMGVMNNAFVTYEDTMLIGKNREKETPQRLLPGNTMQLAHTTGMMFYFNVPRNETLMGYWDTVADRLYKIHNSLNIEGVKRTLALFAPPIDPALFVKAKANGVSISDALADASSALPYYRFKVMVAKAIEIVRDMQCVGKELMDAIEKFDAETLAALRVTHEKTALSLQKTLTELDITELEKELEAVEAEEENLLVEEEQQKSFFKKSEQETKYEKAMEKVKKVQETVENMKKAAGVAYKIPDLSIGGILNGLGGPSFDAMSLGGTKIAENLVNLAEGYASQFAQKQAGAALTKVLGEQNRVEQSWEMQKTAKANQIKNVRKKKTTAQIKIDYAKKQMENFEREIELKDEMYDHLSEKYSNKDLYSWLKKETGDVYKHLFQLAVKVASKAEKCYHFEIGDTEENPKTAKSFIKGSGVYWDGLHNGLLAGEKLLVDLHTMEVAYLENDKNELEITRPVSLREIIGPTADSSGNEIELTALEQLKISSNWTIDDDRNRLFNSISFELSENLFFDDFSQPHNFGRIRDVRLDVIGTGEDRLSAELSMSENILHTSSDDIKNRIGVQTYATSTANSVCGKYSFDFKRNKFTPFEGAGIHSKWNLIISAPLNFNPQTITDVVIHISYTARNG